MKPPSPEQFLGSRRTLALGLGLALAVLAATIVWSTLHVRRHIRAQIAGREGETLASMAAMQHLNDLDDQTSGEPRASLGDPGEQIDLALKISRLRKVLGVRLFSPEGSFVNASPAYITEAALPAEDLADLRALKPVSHFFAAARLEQHDLLAGSQGAPAPLLVVDIPLNDPPDGRLAGVAQFLLNGSSIAREYTALDRHLALQSGLVFLAGGSLLAAGLALALRRLQRANQLLVQRTSNLLQANRELALAAKTSAVGAVASHLIHGLKNPLTGLHSFVQDRALGQGNGQETDWQLAVASTERMNSLINRVVRVLQEQGAADYEISFAELTELLSGRLQPAAHAAGVRFDSRVTAAGALSNRDADLVLLILENLVQNAVDATPAGKMVLFTLSVLGDRVIMEVQDEGPGLPPEVQAQIFSPCVSSKQGGSGIGLAISQQLAKHLGAELSFNPSAPAPGCTFRLALPRPDAGVSPASTPGGCEARQAGSLAV